MVRRWIGAAAAGALALNMAACDGHVPSGNAKPAEKANIEIGNPLYAEVTVPPVARPATPALQGDTVVISGAQIAVKYMENVPTKNSGVLWEICTDRDVKPGPDAFEHPTEKGKFYRRIKEGEVVQRGQLVALLDDRQARAKFNAAVTDLKAAEDMLASARVVAEKAKATFDVYKSSGQSAAKVELFKTEQDWAEKVKALADAQGSRDKAEESLKIAKVALEEHSICAAIDGRIKTKFAHPGEAVKELSPVVLVEDESTLKIEGMLPVQYLPLLSNLVGKSIALEPSAQLGPKTELIGHGSTVTGVAVSGHKPNSIIVTVSEDKTVRVWDVEGHSQLAYAEFDKPLRSVACTAMRNNERLAIIGGDDGQGYIIDLSKIPTSKGRLAEQMRLNGTDAIRKLAERHKERINAVAFSPDGNFCATADDREVFISNVATGAKLYSFNAEHRGPITSVQFTPQTKLVTTARDRTVRVWELGEKAAKVERVLDNRAGNVDVLGVSPDGKEVLFDVDRSLHVRSLAGQQTVALLSAPTDSTQFTKFAIFSNDGQLVVTAGTGDNLLGVWKLPGPGSTRAFQRARLAVGTSQPTCAAFDPNGKFLVVGSQDNRLFVFTRPKEADRIETYSATVTYIDPGIDSTDRKVRIWAELPNPAKPNEPKILIPGDTANMVIPIH